MGRVRTKTTKRAAKQLIEKYYNKLTNDFHFNKKILSEVAVVPSKRMRNKIAGFATHLMKRIQKGPIRGVSLKVQEEQREKRLDYVPEKSKIDISRVVVSQEIRNMLSKNGLAKIPGLVTETIHKPSKADKDHKKKGGNRKNRGKGGNKPQQQEEQHE